MPLTAKKIGDSYRVVERATGEIANNASGTALDGGGHKTLKEARAQATAVNINQMKNGS